jgi:hypothetical protein
MATFTVVFINYYNSDLLPDGLTVNVYPLGSNPNTTSPIDSAVVGVYPSQPGKGQATFTQLSGDTTYTIAFVGQNAPAGSHLMPIMDNLLLTVPIFYGPIYAPGIFSNTVGDLTLIAPGGSLCFTVENASVFNPNTYVIVTGPASSINNDGNYGAFVGYLESINVSTNMLCVFITELMVNSPGSIMDAGAFVVQIAPNDFMGQQGDPGQNGNGSTLTSPISAIPLPTVGEVINFAVYNGSAFPNYTALLVSDGVNSFTGYVTGGGTTNELSVLITSVSGSGSIAPNAIVTFTGLQGPQGLTGTTGASGLTVVGPDGEQGPRGFGTTFTTEIYTCAIAGSGSFDTIYVDNNSSFPINSFFLATDGGSSTIVGQVTGTSGVSAITFNVLESTSTVLVSSVMASGSTVTFSGPTGPQSIVPGPKGDPGYGLPGHGATFLLSPFRILPVGNIVFAYVQDPLAFPPLSYVMVTDGVYSITGQVTTSTTGNQIITSPIVPAGVIPSPNPNLLSIRITSINNGIVGQQFSTGATVTFSGVQGPVGTFALGTLGTAYFRDMPLGTPQMFTSGSQAPLMPVPIKTLTFNLPNNQPINYRVVAEFAGNVISNQVINPSTNVAYVGISSTCATNSATNEAATFAGVVEPIAAGPVIKTATIVADGSCTVNSPGSLSSNNNLVVKYIGTFNFGSQVDFTIVAAAQQLNTTFYVSGILSVTCYPLYQ